MGWALADAAIALLELQFPWPKQDDLCARFYPVQCTDYVYIADKYLALQVVCPVAFLEHPQFNLPDWYASQAISAYAPPRFMLEDLEGELEPFFWEYEQLKELLDSLLELNATGVPGNVLPAVQRNTATPRDFKHLILAPVVVVIEGNGHPACALIDSGLLSDFMSTRLAHQISIVTEELEKPFPVHLAVQGSRAKISTGCTAHVKYQDVSEHCYFDIINLLNYDLILETLFLFQHKISVEFNPTTVIVGSGKALPIEGKTVCTLESHAADVLEDELEKAH